MTHSEVSNLSNNTSKFLAAVVGTILVGLIIGRIE
jgi:hypothetical protein